MFNQIAALCESLSKQFDLISEDRKVILQKIANYINEQKSTQGEVKLVYICTHNSRRSHFGQVWGKVAADFFGIEHVETFSGGTETTQLHANAIKALKNLGFDAQTSDFSKNPMWKIAYGEGKNVTCFSKTYDHKMNPKTGFAAIMTCGDAEENCPFIPGVDLRIATTYVDPKFSDGTDQEAQVYIDKCKEIGRENLYIFSLIH